METVRTIEHHTDTRIHFPRMDDFKLRNIFGFVKKLPKDRAAVLSVDRNGCFHDADKISDN
jgi:hypothetical protein